MACVYEAEPVSFSCVLDVVSDIRAGSVSTLTARKVLKQVDAGIAQFGRPPVGMAALSEEALLDAIEGCCVVEGSSASDKITELLPLLIQLLKLIMSK